MLSSILANFLAWSGPNVIAALAAASIAWCLLTIGKPRHLAHYLVTVGGAVIGVLGLAAIATIFALDPVTPAGMIGIASGVLAALALRPQEL